MMRLRVIWAVIALVAISLSGETASPSQTLARPGWVGSGLTTQTWFMHAILYQIDTHTFASSKSDSANGDLRGITQHLDYIHSLGVDAILLKPLSPNAGGRATAIEPALGSLDDLDDLTLQASRVKIRVLLELATPDAGLARFWLSRGIAGFYIPNNSRPENRNPDNSPANSTAVTAIRKLLPSYVGQRVVISDADLASSPAASKPWPNELLLDKVALEPATNPVPILRAALEQSQTLLHSGVPILEVDAQAMPDPRLAPILATALLLNRSASLIIAGQELGLSPSSGIGVLMPWGQLPAEPAEDSTEPARPVVPATSSPDKYTPFVPYVRPTAGTKKATLPDPGTAAGQNADPKSLLNFYRELSRLHHGTTALRDGEQITFNHDDRGALIWIRKPPSLSQLNPAVLIACNLSEKPVVLSLKAEVARLRLRGTFLRTILRSDDLMGGVSLDPITLPPYGVYIGSLRF